MKTKTEEREFWIKHYGQLNGKTVKEVVHDGKDYDSFYGLRFTDGTIAWIGQDPEGNGPGFLEIATPQKPLNKKGQQ